MDETGMIPGALVGGKDGGVRRAIPLHPGMNGGEPGSPLSPPRLWLNRPNRS